MNSFSKWYEKNKATYNQRRAQKRREDPEYAERQRQYKKRPEPKPEPENGMVMAQVAYETGISVWVLRRWVQNKLVPAPKAWDNSLWWHKDNIGLLVDFGKWFEENGGYRADPSALEDKSNWVQANWTTLEIKNGTEG